MSDVFKSVARLRHRTWDEMNAVGLAPNAFSNFNSLKNDQNVDSYYVYMHWSNKTVLAVIRDKYDPQSGQKYEVTLHTLHQFVLDPHPVRAQWPAVYVIIMVLFAL